MIQKWFAHSYTQQHVHSVQCNCRITVSLSSCKTIYSPVHALIIGVSLSEPLTSESDGTSDRLRTITIKHGKLVYSSIDNLNYTENSRNGLLTIYLTEMAH